MPVTKIRSPKRRPRSQPSRADWFRYYADFSAEFVEDAISHLDLDSGAVLLDPWLGGGTCAEVAAAKRIRFRGYDINPVMLLVSRARTIPTTAAPQIPAFVSRVTRTYHKNVKKQFELTDKVEPLEQWLQPGSAYVVRMLERSVETALCDVIPQAPLWRRTGQVSPLLAFFYVGLFRTLRHFISAYETSNPTWVKIVDNGKRVQLSEDRILNRFHREIGYLLESITGATEAMPARSNRTSVIDRASSVELPLPSNSIDAAVSSPPYCTRIDYVRATLPELAVIGHPNGRVIRRLRERMIGTPTIDECDEYETKDWGTTCSRFLSAVERHTSKASSTYYLKYYQQYFASIFASLKEIDRVLKPNGQCVLVVQDSYYKDKKNNLPRMFVEMAAHYRWSLDRKKSFPVNQTLAGVNPKVREYRNVFKATESVLVFSK